MKTIHRSTWKRHSRKFAVASFGLEVPTNPANCHFVMTISPAGVHIATNRARKRSNMWRLDTPNCVENFSVGVVPAQLAHGQCSRSCVLAERT